MKKIALVVEKYYRKNRIFDLSNIKVNRDDCMYPFWALRRRFAELGFDLSTDDINRPENSDLVLYNDMPTRLPEEADAHKSILLAWESPLIKPQNFDKEKHSGFARIYTYDDRLVDGKKYHKIFYTQRFPNELDFTDRSILNKLMCVIAGNKSSPHPQELYSERLKTIRWYEENHPGELDLYGFGWNERVFRGPRMIRVLNRVPFMKKVFVKDRRSSFRGLAADKRSVFAKYRFALCYENIRDVPGYITEKMIDALLAGCVPIYWGAPNINDYVPGDCFIDRRVFNGENDLYLFLTSMDEKTYCSYRERISAFLLSEKSWPFRAESFVETMVKMEADMHANATVRLKR